jgi:ATP-binding cassette, subfamily B, multidrug efflux pump
MIISQLKIFVSYLKAYRNEMLVGMVALILTDVIGLSIPWILKQFIDKLPSKPSNEELLVFAGLLGLAATFQGLFRFGWRKYIFGPSRKVEFDIVNDLFGHFLKLDSSFYQKLKIGDLLSRATNDIRSVRDFLGLGLLVLADCFVVIISCFALMIYISPKLTLMAFLPLPLISILFYLYTKKISEGHRIVQEELANISDIVQENLSGIRTLHAYGQEDNVKEKFEKQNEVYLSKNMALTKLYAIFPTSLSFFLGLATLISLWIGGKEVIAGNLTLGSFVAFNGYLLMLSWPMMGIGYVFNLSQKGASAMRRVQDIFSEQSEIKAPLNGNFKKDFQGELEFQSVSYQYSENGFYLEDINLKIKPGQWVGITGPIGAGKSTLFKFPLRVIDPMEGKILLDGISIKDLPLDLLRKQIGYVEQGPFLFSASIQENIAFGTDISDEKIIKEFAFIAGLEPDIAAFPKGLETMVGEKGVSLSGGQKQRVALARALIRKPKILILDDAFSSLDVETEEKILNNIRRVAKETTVILITHRVSTQRFSDQIVVIENGKISGLGSREQLEAQEGYFKEISNAQSFQKGLEAFLS